MAVEPNEKVFEALQCIPARLEYDYVAHRGILQIADRGCTDMEGCIRYFQQIDPDVEYIHTYDERGEITNYFREDGNWSAHSYR